MKTYIPSDIKQMNRLSVLEYIRRKPGQSVTRPELSKALQITEPTVLKITKFLQQRGILEEDSSVNDEKAAVGRKPNRLRLNPRAAYTLGIEYDGEQFILAAIDMNMQLVEERTAIYHVTLPELFEVVIPAQVKDLSIPHDRVLGLGLALPLAVDPDTYSVSMRNPVIDYGDSLCFRTQINELSQKLGFAVYMENDVNAAAYSMTRYREQRLEDFIYMAFGFGVGAGILLDGKLRRGKHCTAGEFGYRVLSRPNCDGRTPERTEEMFGHNYILDHFGEDVMGTEPFSNALLDHLADYISLSICDYVYLLDIDNFMLGGFLIIKGGEELLQRIRTRCSKICETPIHISPDMTGRTVVQGMGALVFDYQMDELLDDLQ